MDLYTAEHKTSTTGLRREQFLPLVIPSEGIVHGDWLGKFIELCHSQGTEWEYKRGSGLAQKTAGRV